MSRADYTFFDGYDAEGNPIFTNHADDDGPDSDGDGVIDMFDSYPDDYWNGNPPPPSTLTWGDLTK